METQNKANFAGQDSAWLKADGLGDADLKAGFGLEVLDLDYGSDSESVHSDWMDDILIDVIKPVSDALVQPTSGAALNEDVMPSIEEPGEQVVQQTQSATTASQTPTVTAQMLRPRTRRQQSAAGAARTDTEHPTTSASDPVPESSAHSTARDALFGRHHGSGKGGLAAPQTSNATAEAILDHQRAEQNVLSESILQMASALKASSQRFSDTLDSDKEMLGRAGEGINKTEETMDAASRRMSALRRMTEGKGWWGRMILFAWVYGLMVVLLLLVFVLPKLRF
ncbi:hypothetical protein BROUX41_004073 [Berkeleyomyces rouxiae]|uniref:uncharacterized protein n=1 Tax=Berkeleyomyces rouxiae TaxID=2035830 RepID=UPI003B7D5FBF